MHTDSSTPPCSLSTGCHRARKCLSGSLLPTVPTGRQGCGVTAHWYTNETGIQKSDGHKLGAS